MGLGTRSLSGEAGDQRNRKKGAVTADQRQRWQIGTPVASGIKPQLPRARGSADYASLKSRRSSSGSANKAVKSQQTAAPSVVRRAMADAMAAAQPAAAEQAQTSGFSSPAAAAQAESDISPFRAMQDQEAAAQQSGEQQPGGSSRHLRSGSLESNLSNETADSQEGTFWTFGRPRVADANAASIADANRVGGNIDAQRVASIAIERQGVAAERAGRDDPAAQSARLRDVELNPEAGGIWVARDWEAKEGVHLTPDLVLGKVLGSGFQAHVFELKDAAGRVAPIVLKAARSGALINDTRREWATGQRLAALGSGDAVLPGIMKVGPAVCRGRKRSSTKGTKLIGMILERINGKSVSKVVADPDFHDIHYICEMLRQIFTALDASQRAFGFHHYDLRLDNIMEHVPLAEQDAADPVSRSMCGRPDGRRGGSRTFKMIDFGLARFDEDYAADEGADTHLEIPGRRKSPWFMAPLRCLGSAPEAVHQAAWRGKGDVYHLLFDLSQKIHGRVWPEKDRAQVQRLLSLIRHTTGVKPGATFYSEASETAAQPHCMPVQCFGVPAQQRKGLRGRSRSCMHRFHLLRWILQLKAWQWPSNPGLTAAEVLTSPLFR